MATPPPPGHSKRKFTGNAWQEGLKRLRPNLQSSSAAARSSASSAPGAISTSPSPPATPGPSLAITPPPAHAHTVSGASGSAASSSTQAAATAQAGAKHNMADKFKQATIAGLESALRALHISASAIPGLKPAVDGLIDCLDVVQAATSSAEEYDEIISNLNIIAASLKEYVGELGLEDPSGNPACSLIAWNIEKEVARIQEQKNRNKIRRALEAVEDKEHVMKCYRRVEGLFQQLQSNICLQTLKNTNKHRLTSLLDRLHPVADARYDSRYSTTVRRHGCTKETREQVQVDLQRWVQDPNSANIYWMNGMAGTGKTTIAYSLCEWLETQKQLGASFFCSRVSSSCRDADSIIPTIAYELACYSPAFRVKLGKVLEEDPNTSARDVARQFERLIQGPMLAVQDAMPYGVVIIVDALDECEDAHRVGLLLQAVLRLGTILPLKYFIASRPEPAILERMLVLAENSRTVLHLHDIEHSIVEGDIKKYIEDELSVMSPPPDVKQIDQLVKLAGKLFIYAATVTRYILPGAVAVNSAARLKAVLATGSATTNKELSGKQYKQLDELYAAVLATPLDEDILEQEEIETMRLVLWTVVCAEEPMTILTLASFLSLDNTQVLPVLKALRSVLHVSESNGLVSTLHASFPDFMLDNSRSGKYYCDPFQHSGRLARRCFDIMQAQLRFNICNLESSLYFDEDIVDMKERIAKNISPELSYACRYWGEHLRRATPSNRLYYELFEFFIRRLLFWMEVLNVSQYMAKGILAIARAEKWLPSCSPSKHKQLLADVKDFVTRFAAGGCSRSTPHIYISALPFCGKSNSIYECYWGRMRGLIDVRGTATGHLSAAAQATWKTPDIVYSIALSPDGTRIVSGHHNGFMLIWDIYTGEAVIELVEGHTEEISSVAFSPDGTRVASGSYDRMIRVWDAHTGLSLAGPFAEHTDMINSIAFSPDGTRIASASRDRTVRVWDATAGKAIVGPLQGHTHSVNSVVFSPSGTRIASGSDDKTVRLWDLSKANTVAEQLHGHTAKVNAVAISPCGALIASGSDDHTILLWDSSTGNIVTTIHQGIASTIQSVAFSPDNARIVSGSNDSSINVWDTHNGNVVAGPFSGHTDWVCSVTFSPDGARIVSGSFDSTIRLWDAQKNENIAIDRRTQKRTGYIISVALSSDGTRIASGSSDKTIRVWDAYTGTAIVGPLIGHTESIRSVSFSPDGTRLVSGSLDHTIRLWDVHTGNALTEPFLGHTNSVRSVVFSPSGGLIASGSSDHTVRLWNAYKGNTIVGPFMGHTSWVNMVAFSPDSTRVASVSADGTIRTWDTCTGAMLAELPVGTKWSECVGFSSDGTHVVSWAPDCTAWVCDVSTGISTTTTSGLLGTETQCSILSSDGTHFAIGAYNGDSSNVVALWDIKASRIVAGPLYGHTKPITSVALSSDRTRLVSCSYDGSIRVWDLTSGIEDFKPNDDGWFMTEDGPLFWAPLDFHSHVPHPRNTLLLTPEGTISIDYDAMLVGDRWAECYDPEQFARPTDLFLEFQCTCGLNHQSL